MEFNQIFFRKSFWITVALSFIFLTLIEWRYWLYSGIVNFIVDFLLSLIVSFFISVIIFGVIWAIDYFIIHLVDFNRFINTINYQ